ncbi:MAG: phosphate ABC transporter substrate-binding protein PstS [Nitrososphaerales archaeon]
MENTHKQFRGRSAIATVAIVGIVVVIIAILGVGAYIAISSSGTTKTVTQSGSTVTRTTTQSNVITSTIVSGGSTVVTTITGQGSTQTVSHTAFVTSTATASISITLTSTLPSETVSETGSSLLYPLFNLWVPNFTSTYSSVHLTPASTGSGTGQADAEKGVVQVGASDAYLTNAQETEYPYILNIPLAISAQQVNYNIPSIPTNVHLNFSGPVLAGIYNGSITYWDDASIKAMQSLSVANMLPHQTIIPIHRSDGSGDTFIFTQYLSFSSSSWNSSVGYGTAVTWPNVAGEQSANGNGGMVQLCNSTQYSIAYIGVSFLKEATVNNHTPLGYAYLKNYAGNYVNITQTNIQAAANVMVSQTPADERLSLVFAPGANSYPIINYEYAMVSKNQNATGMAGTLRTLLAWALDPQYGNSPYFLNQVSFVPLPQSVVQLSLAQINEIQGP